MTFNEYLKEVQRQFFKFPSLRLGQTYFYVFNQLSPALARAITGSSIDPFHDDRKLEAFCSFVHNILGDLPVPAIPLVNPPTTIA